MPGIRRFLNIPRLTRTTRVYQNHAWFKREANRPPKGGRGVGLGGPLPVMWTGFEEGLAAPLNR
eukprot:4534102-Prymnesium_polylepis.1